MATPEEIWALAWKLLRAHAWADIRGWGDPRPLWCVQFKNGAMFSGYDKEAVGDEARTYYTSVKRLTGNHHDQSV